MSKKKESPKSSGIARDSKTGKFSKVKRTVVEKKNGGKDKPPKGTGTDDTGPKRR